MREIEKDSEKEDSATLSACLEEKDMNTCGTFRLSQNKVDDAETIVDKCVVGEDINSKWDDAAVNTLHCCKEPGISSDINSFETNEAIDNGQDDIDGINEHIKSCGLHLNTTVSSSVNNTAEAISLLRSESVSSDDYRVEQTQLKEKDVAPSKHPQLCTSPTADSHYYDAATSTQPKEFCDGRSSSISSSASSLASNMSDYKIEVSTSRVPIQPNFS